MDAQFKKWFTNSDQPEQTQNPETAQYDKNLTALQNAGVRSPTAEQLAGMPHVNEELIRANIHQTVEIEGRDIALAIWKIKNNIYRHGP